MPSDNIQQRHQKSEATPLIQNLTDNNSDSEDDDEIQIISSPVNPTSRFRTLPANTSRPRNLALHLQNQNSEQNRPISRESERRNNRNGSGFYNNPNDHIHDSDPILITSDTEDNDIVEESNNTDTNNTLRFDMPLSADQESIRNAQNTQRRVLRNLVNRSNSGNENDSSFQMYSQHGHNNYDADNDDDIEVVAERDVPDVQILQTGPATPGYELHTPSGPLFVPTDPDEIRTVGVRNRTNMQGTDESRHSDTRSRSHSPTLSSFVRAMAGSASTRQQALRRQREFRRQQLEANRRARDAAAGTVAGRVQRRRPRTSVRPSNPSTTIGPREPPRLMFDGIRAYSTIFRFLESMEFPLSGVDMDASNGDVPENIMRILQDRDEQRENDRIRSRTNIATGEKKKMAKDSRISGTMKKKYSNNLGEENQNDVCVLCGITLLQGIPADYNSEEKLNKRDEEIKDLVKEGFQSPWRAWEKFSNMELDLSKKVFFAPCGHMYCGRCVNNIMKYRSLTARQRKDELKKTKNGKGDLSRVSATGMDFENPGFSAPLKCVADECTKRFVGKTPFNELYV